MEDPLKDDYSSAVDPLKIKQELTVSDGPENDICIYEEPKVKQELDIPDTFDEPHFEQLNELNSFIEHGSDDINSIFIKQEDIEQKFIISDIHDSYETENHKSCKNTADFDSLIILHCEKCNVSHNLSKERITQQCLKCNQIMTYICQVCKDRRKTYNGIIMHLKTKCKGTKYYYCNDCDYKNIHKRFLQYHMLKYHLGQSQSLTKCRKCNMTYRDKYYLQRHKQTCGIYTHLFCTFCPFKTKSVLYLENHMKKFHIDEFNSYKELDSIINNIVKKGKALKGKTFKIAMQSSRMVSVSNLLNRYCPKCTIVYDPERYKKITSCLECESPFYFECKNCKRKDSNYNSMYYHIMYKCYPRQIFICDHCDFKTSRKQTLAVHLKFKHFVPEPKDYNVCSKCGKGFKAMAILQGHEQICKSDQIFDCTFCSFKTKYKSSYASHMHQHLISNSLGDVGNDSSRVSQVKVNGQNSVKSESETLEIIKKMIMKYCWKCDELSEPIFRCTKCKKCHHILTFRCGECRADFGNRKAIFHHVKRFHAPPQPQQCLKCKKFFATKKTLKIHSIYCGKQPQMQCQYCPYKTKTKYLLSHHTQVRHSSMDPVICITCGKGCKNSYALQYHKRFCNKEPTLHCAHCEFKTFQKNKLTKHLFIIHVHLFTNRSLQCNICNIKISNIYLLENHIANCGK